MKQFRNLHQYDWKGRIVGVWITVSESFCFLFSLTLEQRELCRARKKLLQYLYRLKTYEVNYESPNLSYFTLSHFRMSYDWDLFLLFLVFLNAELNKIHWKVMFFFQNYSELLMVQDLKKFMETRKKCLDLTVWYFRKFYQLVYGSSCNI